MTRQPELPLPAHQRTENSHTEHQSVEHAQHDSQLLFPDEHNQRREFRLTGRVFVRIEVQAEDPHSGESAEYLQAVTQDISSSGASLSTLLELPVGALVPVCIDIEGEDLSFHLSTEVMWCRASAGGESGFRVGLQFLESDDTGIIDWKEAVVRWLSKEAAD